MGLSRANLQTIATRTGRKVVAAWSDRDQGAMGTVVGVVMHHTGSAWTDAVAPTLQIVREGRSDLQNALCTFYIDKAGTIYLVTEKVAWHAGQGAYRGITDGNGHFLGIEAESDGVHWTTDTVNAYVVLVAEICRFLGVDPATWAIRHATWATPPGRKTDFAGLSEADFKARVTARLNGAPLEDDLPTVDDVWNALVPDRDADARSKTTGSTVTAREALAHAMQESAQAHQLAQQVADRVGVLESSGPVVAGGTAVIDYAKLATAVADELDRRARDGNPATGPVS